MKLLALALIAAAPALAFADDPDRDNARTDMAAVTAPADACTALRKDMDEKTACKPIAHAKLAGGATADLYAVTGKDLDVWRYAVVVTAGDRSTVSPMIEADASDCGMNKCDLLVGATPKLHAIAGGKEVAIEITARFQHQTTSPDEPHPKPRVTERWSTFDALVCDGKVCLRRHRGDRQHSCTGSISADSTMTTHCDETSYIDLL